MRSTTPVAAHLGRALLAAAAVVASAAVTAPALAAPAGAYKGKTSQKKNASLKVVGQKVNNFRFAYSAPCDDGRTYTSTFIFNPIDLNGRRFAIQGPASGKLEDGTRTALNLKLAGKFNENDSIATGTVSVRVELPNAAGDGVATCKTGRLTYTVRKQVS